MERVLTGLELRAIIQELNKLVGSHLNKIHQPNSKTLLLGFRKKGGDKFTVKVDSGVGVFLSSHDYKTGEIPPSFCMFLRKHLMNASLLGIQQKGVERVVEFRLSSKEGEKSLICELFSQGNFILTDKDYIILNLAVNKSVKDRTLKKGQKYAYPPERFNALELTQTALLSALKKWGDHKVVQMIASGIGLGGVYAEEVCLRTGIKKDTPCSKLSEADGKKLFTGIQKLLGEIDKSSIGYIYFKDGSPHDISPISLKSLSDFDVKKVASFNEAVDVLFASAEGARIKKEKSASYEKKLQSLKQRLEIQKRSLEDYREKWKENQRIADEVYNNYQTISNILDKIGGARRVGYSWEEIQNVIAQEKSAGVREASLILQVLPHEDKVIVNVAGGMKLDLKKNVSQNASKYYDAAKASRVKIAGAERIVAKTEQEIEKLTIEKRKITSEIEKALPKPVEVKKKEWYEKFRWFYTSSGKLAIGGRDAKQNDMIIKRYVEINDLIFHTELPGSPFFILKGARDKITKSEAEEVAVATASFSRAWASGQTVTDVYWVKPEQVTKKAQAGEYLTKGAFMVRGKKNFLRSTALQLSIGVDKQGRIMSGPLKAVAAHCEKHVSLRQGQEKKSETAKKIARELNSSQLDTIMQSLPGGTFSLAK